MQNKTLSQMNKERHFNKDWKKIIKKDICLVKNEKISDINNYLKFVEMFDNDQLIEAMYGKKIKR